VSSLLEHFGGKLGHTPAETFGDVVVVYAFLRESEVCQAGMPILIEYHVVRLEVTLDYFLFVQVLYGQQYLTELEASRGFVEPFVLVQQLSQVPVGTLVQDQEQSLFCLKSLVEAHYERVSHLGEYVALRHGLSRQIPPHYFRLLKYLHSLQIQIVLLLNQLHFTE
jgi:hypothetical protein